MKVSIARIRLYLKEGKTLADGSNPIMLMYMMKGGSPMNLATLLGRSANTLSQYIKELSEEGDLVEAVSIL